MSERKDDRIRTRLPPRRPLVGLALAFTAGTWFGLRTSLPPLPLALAAATLVAAAMLATWVPAMVRRLPARLTTLGFILALAGLAAANARLEVARPAAPTLAEAGIRGGVELRAIVTDDPMPSGLPMRRGACKFPAELIAWRTGTTWQAASGEVRVRWYGFPSAQPAYGDAWQWRGTLESFTPRRTAPSAHAPSRPDILLFSTAAAQGQRLSTGNGNPVIGWCLSVRRACLDTLTTGIGDFSEASGVLVSLVLGYRSQIPTDLYQAFASTGTLHVFAVSGSHVVVIGGAIVFLLSACGMPRTRWVLVLAPTLAAYTIMTGLQPSAVRACIMGTAYAAGPLFNRRSDLYSSLGLAAVLILGVTPTALDDLGFILSFTAVVGLGLFYPVLARPLHARLSPDPLQLQPEPGWQAALRSFLHHIASLLAMSLAAWLVTTPLTAWYFGLFSPIALPGNLAAVPLASLIIVTGLVSLAAGSFTLVLADLFNHANLALAALLSASIRALDALPGGHMVVSDVPALAIAGWYALLLLWRFALWVRSPPDPSLLDVGPRTV